VQTDSEQPGPDPAPATSRSRDTRPVLLVVEDEPDDWVLLERAFERVGMGATIHHALNGHEAVRFLHKQRPTCILLDLKMPMLNGFQLLEHIRSIDFLKMVPVVVLSASPNEQDVARAYQAGANAYLVKPGSFQGLVDATRAFRDQWLR
jgi:CheY-like chemotaxis protein